MKNLHKFYNKDNLHWVNLVSEVYYSSVLPPVKSKDVFFLVERLSQMSI
jgi:hypothetical protein